MLELQQGTRYKRQKIPDCLFGGIAVYLLSSQIPGLDYTVKVRSHYRIGRIFYKAFHVFLGLHHLSVKTHYLFLVEHPVGDVLDEDNCLDDFTLFVLQRIGSQFRVVQAARLGYGVNVSGFNSGPGSAVRAYSALLVEYLQ